MMFRDGECVRCFVLLASSICRAGTSVAHARPDSGQNFLISARDMQSVRTLAWQIAGATAGSGAWRKEAHRILETERKLLIVGWVAQAAFSTSPGPLWRRRQVCASCPDRQGSRHHTTPMASVVAGHVAYLIVAVAEGPLRPLLQGFPALRAPCSPWRMSFTGAIVGEQCIPVDF